jgi:transcriptional regulator with XRE-family HTH domain
MVHVNDKLAEWIVTQADDRGWSYRELARRSGVSHTTISQVISGQRIPTFDFCADVARALGESPVELFRLAGLLPAMPERRRKELEEIGEILAGLPDGPIRDEAMAAIRAIAQSARERAVAREKAG